MTLEVEGMVSVGVCGYVYGLNAMPCPNRVDTTLHFYHWPKCRHELAVVNRCLIHTSCEEVHPKPKYPCPMCPWDSYFHRWDQWDVEMHFYDGKEPIAEFRRRMLEAWLDYDD